MAFKAIGGGRKHLNAFGFDLDDIERLYHQSPDTPHSASPADQQRFPAAPPFSAVGHRTTRTPRPGTTSGHHPTLAPALARLAGAPRKRAPAYAFTLIAARPPVPHPHLTPTSCQRCSKRDVLSRSRPHALHRAPEPGRAACHRPRRFITPALRGHRGAGEGDDPEGPAPGPRRPGRGAKVLL